MRHVSNRYDALGVAAKAARNEAEVALDRPLQYRLEWSERLTRSAGVAVGRRDGRRAAVRLSAPIFRQAVADLGISGACDEVRTTVLHEIAHLVSEDGHGPEWRSVMWRLGANPTGSRCHTMRSGGELGSAAAQEAMVLYPVGTWVEYRARGRQFVGEVKRHNTKSLSVTVEAELLDGWWEDTTRRRWWRIPWRLVDGAVIGVVD